MTINRKEVLLTILVRFDGEAAKPSEIAMKDRKKNAPALHSFQYSKECRKDREEERQGAIQVRNYFIQHKTRRGGKGILPII